MRCFRDFTRIITGRAFICLAQSIQICEIILNSIIIHLCLLKTFDDVQLPLVTKKLYPLVRYQIPLSVP